MKTWWTACSHILKSEECKVRDPGAGPLLVSDFGYNESIFPYGVFVTNKYSLHLNNAKQSRKIREIYKISA